MDRDVQQFNIGTGTDDVTVTLSGMSGVTPKILILNWSGRTGSTGGVSGDSHRYGWGMYVNTGTAKQRCICSQSEDGQSQVDCDDASRNDAVIQVLAVDGSEDGRASVKSVGSGQFVLQIDNQFSLDVSVGVLALGGSDVVAADIISSITKNTTGTQDYTVGLGGETPNFGMFLSHAYTTENQGPSASIRGPHVGFFVGTAAADQAAHWIGNSSGSTSIPPYSGCNGAGANGEALQISGTNALPNVRAAVSSLSANTVQLNYSEADGSLYYFFLLSATLTNVALEAITTRTDSNDITVSGLGFKPACGIWMSAMTTETSQDGRHSDSKASVGMFVDETNRVVHSFLDYDTDTTTKVTTAFYEDAAYARIDQATDTIVGKGDVKSIDTGGATFVMDDPDPAAAFGFGVFFGPAPAAGGGEAVCILTGT